tara:strand:- start:96441 stop:97322 length:882 start_codon:yes stop_codon:yes gene_type:complete
MFTKYDGALAPVVRWLNVKKKILTFLVYMLYLTLFLLPGYFAGWQYEFSILTVFILFYVGYMAYELRKAVKLAISDHGIDVLNASTRYDCVTYIDLVAKVNALCKAHNIQKPVCLKLTHSLGVCGAGVTALPEEYNIYLSPEVLHLPEHEIDFIIGHEFGHVVNNDMQLNVRGRIVNILFLLHVGFVSLADLNSIYLLFFSAITVVLLFFMNGFNERCREYLADIFSVQLNETTLGAECHFKRIFSSYFNSDNCRRRYIVQSFLLQSHPLPERRLAFIEKLRLLIDRNVKLLG